VPPGWIALHVTGIWAVLPIKRTDQAKQRMRAALSPMARQDLAIAMFRDVLGALTASPGLAGIAVVTVDAAVGAYASQAGCRVLTGAAMEGHTAAVMSAARMLAAEGRCGMLTLPGDIPLVTPAEIAALLAAHRPGRAFTIAPSHDEGGSNGIVVSPPDAIALRFGEDSFHPHCAAAAACGLVPAIVKLPGFACDLDNPEDIGRFLAIPSTTRTRAVLAKQIERAGP
jgi:2-phospho-L-lactate guanylyltransferase